MEFSLNASNLKLIHKQHRQYMLLTYGKWESDINLSGQRRSSGRGLMKTSTEDWVAFRSKEKDSNFNID